MEPAERPKSIVVVIVVTDGEVGVLPKPKVTGGSTGVSAPRSSPSHDADAAVMRC